MGSVDNKVQEADRLKNITANLQAQLRQNMSALEEKLRRAREYVAKVRKRTAFSKTNVRELTVVFYVNSYGLLYSIRVQGVCSANRV